MKHKQKGMKLSENIASNLIPLQVLTDWVHYDEQEKSHKSKKVVKECCKKQQ